MGTVCDIHRHTYFYSYPQLDDWITCNHAPVKPLSYSEGIMSCKDKKVLALHFGKDDVPMGDVNRLPRSNRQKHRHDATRRALLIVVVGSLTLNGVLSCQRFGVLGMLSSPTKGFGRAHTTPSSIRFGNAEFIAAVVFLFAKHRLYNSFPVSNRFWV